MSCKDMMIWVGASYYKIDCGLEEVSSEACDYGPRGKVKRCYVHEAEYRGCCRKVPNLIPWAVPGETRVFLAHSGGWDEGHHGVLFGYFLFKRFEIVVEPDTYDCLDDPDCIPWSDDLSDNLLKEIYQKAREDYASKPLRRDDFRHIEDMKNCQFERRRWELARRVAQGQVVYREPRYGPQEDPFQAWLGKLFQKVKEELLEYLLEKNTRDWSRRVLSDPDSEIRMLNCLHTAGEEIRACSSPNSDGCLPLPLPHKRTKPGTIYVVDPLTAQITDLFIDLLLEGPEDPTGVEDEDIEIKEEKFRRAVNRAHKQRSRKEHQTHDAMERLPSALRKRMTKRGELVLFPRPFPVIQRCPKASFQGYLRVDGDQLAKEVERSLGERRRLVKVPYCTGLERDRPMTKAQLQSYLARELLVNQSMAGNILEALSKRAIEDIAQNGRFVLPGVGSFSLESDGEVRFYAYRPLRDRLKQPHETDA